MLTATLIKAFYQYFLKPILFKLNPEYVHDSFISIGSILGKSSLTRKLTKKIFNYQNSILEQKLFNLKFKNPVGLSAGFDKNGRVTQIIPNVGFGYMQVGSITHKPYKGNPKPRVLRLPKSKAILVYYGLKNIGAKLISHNLKSLKHEKNFPISISIAKTNCAQNTNQTNDINDYLSTIKILKQDQVGDIYTINISCPNTFGGEPFTTPKRLKSLLKEISNLNTQKPIMIKMPINLPWSEFKVLVEVAITHKVSAVIIGNLNKDRSDPAIKDDIKAQHKGSISGKPTERLSNQLIQQTYKNYGNQIKIIGVGGIFSAKDAYKKIKLGASLVQVYTGMIYKGPQLIGQINKKLATMLKKDGYKNISEAIGKSN